ncbi:MAG: porin family protein [Ferruginibacter sp.]
MQDVENDMDDLFQRAAQDYPLKPGKEDWQSVYDRIKDESNEPAPALPLRKKRNTIVTVLATLLVLSLASLVALHQYDTSKSRIPQSSATKQAGEKPLPSELATIPGSDPENIKDSEPLTGSPVQKDALIEAGNDVMQQPSKKSANTKYAASHSSTFPAGSTVSIYADPVTQEIENQASIEKISPAVISFGQLVQHETTVSRVNLPAAVTATKKNKPLVSSSRLYAGIVAGVGFNKGKSMKFNTKGFNYGFIAGYQLSNRIALESGLIVNNPNYVSKGEYFNMSKMAATMPAGMVINNLESNTTLLEIPLKIKYDVVKKNNAALFITGGISSYIITRETNNYNISMNGQPDKMTGIYADKSYEIPAAIDLSVGYQKRVSSFLNIRVEPFLKIPIQGIGVGNLPVTSAGLQVVLTGKFK